MRTSDRRIRCDAGWPVWSRLWKSEKARLRKVCGGIPWGSRDEAYQMYPLIPKGGRTDWENQGGETATLPNVRRR